MNEAVKRAMEIIKNSEWDTDIPELEIGDIVEINDVWDGERSIDGLDEFNYKVGEEHSCSYQLDADNGINYLFEIVEHGEYIEPEYDENGYETNYEEAELALRNAKIKITDIYLI